MSKNTKPIHIPSPRNDLQAEPHRGCTDPELFRKRFDPGGVFHVQATGVERTCKQFSRHKEFRAKGIGLTVKPRKVRIEANRDNAKRIALIVPGRPEPVEPTHWSLGQLCGLVGQRPAI